MSSFADQFNELVTDSHKAGGTAWKTTAGWVRWMRDEGYARRMHGDLLHKAIVDSLCECDPA